MKSPAALALPPSPWAALTAQAWSGMLVTLVLMLLVDLEQQAMSLPYPQLSRALALDPGPRGLTVLVWLACLNLLVQMVLRSGQRRGLRWAALGLTLGYTAVFMLHQLLHLLGGEPWGLQTVLDVTHHLLGWWGSWSAWRWCQEGAPPHTGCAA